MKKNQSSITDELLVKYLLNEAISDTEIAQVQQWLNESADNKKQFYELKLIWNQSKHTAVKSIVNTQDAWARFKLRIDNAASRPKTIPIPVNNYKWLKIAAVLLLLAGGSWLAWQQNATRETRQLSAVQKVPVDHKKSTPLSLPENVPPPVVAVNAKVATTAVKQTAAIIKEKRQHKAIAANKMPVNHTTTQTEHVGAKKYICNGTPCPLEICITQTVKCQNGQPAAYSTCSTLEPDQSGQISLKKFDNMAKNCSVNVQEIKITRLTTGESIILNDNSSPATAQDLYNYITGQKKGDILAGIFHSDCDNELNDHILRFDNNNYGHLILQ